MAIIVARFDKGDKGDGLGAGRLFGVSGLQLRPAPGPLLDQASQGAVLLQGLAELAFAALENAGQAVNAMFTVEGLSLRNLVETEVLRGVLTPVGHRVWTAILGGVLFRTAAATGRLLVGGALVGWYLLVALLHGLSDALPGIAVWLTLLFTATPVQVFSFLTWGCWRWMRCSAWCCCAADGGRRCHWSAPDRRRPRPLPCSTEPGPSAAPGPTRRADRPSGRLPQHALKRQPTSGTDHQHPATAATTRRSRGMLPAMSTLVDRLLPDELWQRIQPLLPPAPARPRGGVPRRVPDHSYLLAPLTVSGHIGLASL